jgi:hypothetical protein
MNDESLAIILSKSSKKVFGKFTAELKETFIY